MKSEEINFNLDRVISVMKACDFHMNEDRYIELLAQTYFFVKHSIPLLKEAIKNTPNQEFIQRSLEHIHEEQGHDKIALNDLKALGIDIGSLREWNWTKSFYGKQYELIKKDGEILLGYILALEGIAVKAAEILSNLQNCYGSKGTKFAKLHVEEDQDHLPKAIEQINVSKFREEIYQNFFDTINDYIAFLTLLSSNKYSQQVA